MSIDNQKNLIPLSFTPVVEGHHTDRKYRLFGYAYYAYLSFKLSNLRYEFITRNFTYLKYFKFPAKYDYKSFQQYIKEIHSASLNNNLFKMKNTIIPMYVLFDLIYRNNKYSRDKTSTQILLYNVDLLLFHTIATYLLPGAFYRYFALNIPNFLVSKMIYPYKWFVLGTTWSILLYTTPYLARNIDKFTDLVLNGTYRKLTSTNTRIVEPEILEKIKKVKIA